MLAFKWFALALALVLTSDDDDDDDDDNDSTVVVVIKSNQIGSKNILNDTLST
jgi:hypothetical protein